MYTGLQLLEIAALLFAVLAGLLAGGVWIAISLMAVGWLGMLFVGGIPAGSVLATTVWGNSASWELAALPLFIWMGEILFRTQTVGGDVSRPCAVARACSGPPDACQRARHRGCSDRCRAHRPRPAQRSPRSRCPSSKKRGYDEMLSLGSLAGAGTLGILIPPSITMVVYAVAANVSIMQLFLAGFIPGLLVMALYSGYIAVWSLLNPAKMPPPEPSMTFSEEDAASRPI